MFFASFLISNIFLMGAFLGLGCLAHTLLSPPLPIGRGLKLAWGHAFYLVLVGFNVVFFQGFSFLLNCTVLVGGWIFLLYNIFKSSKNWTYRGSGITLVGVIILFCFWLYSSFCAIYAPVFNPYAEFLAYIPHAKMPFVRGWIDDPFSFRRLASYSGQSSFLSLYLAFWNESSVYFFEKAYLPLAFAFLVFEIIKKIESRIFIFLINHCKIITIKLLI